MRVTDFLESLPKGVRIVGHEFKTFRQENGVRSSLTVNLIIPERLVSTVDAQATALNGNGLSSIEFLNPAGSAGHHSLQILATREGKRHLARAADYLDRLNRPSSTVKKAAAMLGVTAAIIGAATILRKWKKK